MVENSGGVLTRGYGLFSRVLTRGFGGFFRTLSYKKKVEPIKREYGFELYVPLKKEFEIIKGIYRMIFNEKGLEYSIKLPITKMKDFAYEIYTRKTMNLEFNSIVKLDNKKLINLLEALE